VEADEVDVLAAAVFRDLEQVEDTEEAGLLGESRRDVGNADGFDGVDFNGALLHAVAAADQDVGTSPKPDARSDFAATNAVAQALGERHWANLARLEATSEHRATKRDVGEPDTRVGDERFIRFRRCRFLYFAGP